MEIQTQVSKTSSLKYYTLLCLCHPGSPGALVTNAGFLTHPRPAQSGLLGDRDSPRKLYSQEAPNHHIMTGCDAGDLCSDSKKLRPKRPSFPSSRAPSTPPGAGGHHSFGKGRFPLSHFLPSFIEEHLVPLASLQRPWQRWRAGRRVASLAEGLTSFISGQPGSPGLMNCFSAFMMGKAQRGPSVV